MVTIKWMEFVSNAQRALTLKENVLNVNLITILKFHFMDNVIAY